MNIKTTSLVVFALISFMAFLALNANMAQAQDQPYSVPPSDAPELAAIGSFPVGVKTLRMVNPKQPDLPKAVIRVTMESLDSSFS